MALRAVAAAEAAPPSDKKLVLAAWETKVYQYDRSGAADAGFGVLAVKGQAGSRLLVMDTVRSTTITKRDRTELWGCGFRFIVEVSDIELTSKLTLPAIAASMEVTALEASVRLEVKGYIGDEMWDVIPSPKPLDVDTYRMYMDAVEKIQKAFASNPDKTVPVLLAEGSIGILAGGIDDTDIEASVLVGWALERLAGGQSLTRASEELSGLGTGMGSQAAEVLAQTYRSVIGSDDADTVPEPARTRASDYLSRFAGN